MNRLSISIVLLATLVLMVSIPAWIGDEPTNKDVNPEDEWLPNYQANSLRSTLYNKQGEINYQISASNMEHFELLGFTIFNQPQYTIYVEEQNPWVVVANEGTLYEDQRVQFENDIEITQINSQGFKQTIRTHFIEIDLASKTMQSDQLVQIIGPNYTINSNGLAANLETQKYELLDHVQTVFRPLSHP